MQENQEHVLDSGFSNSKTRRRALLPWWIKFFVWIFIILGSIVPFGLVYGLLNLPFQISLYGLTAYQPFSTLGLGLAALLILKGITAYGLWFEQAWATDLAIIDAVLGITICLIIMFNTFLNAQSGQYSFKLELILLIPYLIKMLKIRQKWKKVATP